MQFLGNVTRMRVRRHRIVLGLGAYSLQQDATLKAIFLPQQNSAGHGVTVWRIKIKEASALLS